MLGGILQAVGWAFLPLVALPVICLIAPARKLQEICASLVEVIDWANHFIGETVKWLLPLLVLSVAASVFALSVFGTASVKWLESALYFQAAVILLGCAVTLLAGQHVRVDVFHERMGPMARARVEILGYYLLLLPTCLLIVWNSQSFVAFAWMTFEGSTESDGIRGVFLLKTLIPAFGITLLAQGLAIALRGSLLLSDRPSPERAPGVPPLFEDV